MLIEELKTCTHVLFMDVVSLLLELRELSNFHPQKNSGCRSTDGLKTIPPPALWPVAPSGGIANQHSFKSVGDENGSAYFSPPNLSIAA